MFDFIIQSSQKRILRRAELALDSGACKVELCSEEGEEFTLLVDGHLDVWIAEDDWECTCTSKISPCQHVLMSVLAIQRGSVMKRTKTVLEGHIRHKLLESSTGIMLKRVWVQRSEDLVIK